MIYAPYHLMSAKFLPLKKKTAFNKPLGEDGESTPESHSFNSSSLVKASVLLCFSLPSHVSF